MLVQGLLIAAEPMRVMAKGSESSDRLPSYLLQRVASDNEMGNTGWIAKSTYFLIPTPFGTIPVVGFYWHLLGLSCGQP